jgi:ribosomal protein L11 methyltransferase
LQFLDKLSSVALAVPGQDVALAVPGQKTKLKHTQEPSKTKSFLDLGCGSGILSIAASKLGFCPVTAIDIDPDSVRIAAENFEANGIAELIQVSEGDVSRLELNQTYDIVTANILAVVLLANAEKIAATVNSGHGYLLLAGILTEQYPTVRDAYTKLGFKEIENTTEKEWTSGYFIRSRNT